VLYGIGIVLTGVLQAHRRFGGPALAPLLSSLVVIAAYVSYGVLASDTTDVATLTTSQELVLSIGTTLGVVALTMSLVVPVSRLGLRLRPALSFPLGVARNVRALAYAGMAALTAQQASVAVVLLLGNQAFDVAVAVYSAGQAVFLLPWAVLAVPVATAVFPRLAERWSAGDGAEYARQLSASARLVVVLSLGAAAAMVAAARPLAQVVFEGAPGVDSVGTLQGAIVGFSFGLVGYALFALLSRALYAAQVTRATALACVAGWATVIVADLVLATALPRTDRVLALSVGNSVGMCVLATALASVVMARAGRAALAGVGRLLLIGTAAAVVAGWCGWQVTQSLEPGGVWLAVGHGLVGAAVSLAGFALLVAVAARESLRQSLSVLRGHSGAAPTEVGAHEPA